LTSNTPLSTHTDTPPLHDALPTSQSNGPAVASCRSHGHDSENQPKGRRDEEEEAAQRSQDRCRHDRDLGPAAKMLIRENVDHQQDRKSTRLNSSHVSISYAVFCLK